MWTGSAGAWRPKGCTLWARWRWWCFCSAFQRRRTSLKTFSVTLCSFTGTQLRVRLPCTQCCDWSFFISCRNLSCFRLSGFLQGRLWNICRCPCSAVVSWAARSTLGFFMSALPCSPSKVYLCRTSPTSLACWCTRRRWPGLEPFLCVSCCD